MTLIASIKDGLFNNGPYLWTSALFKAVSIAEIVIGISFLTAAWIWYQSTKNAQVLSRRISLGIGTLIGLFGVSYLLRAWAYWSPAYGGTALVNIITSVVLVIGVAYILFHRSKVQTLIQQVCSQDVQRIELKLAKEQLEAIHQAILQISKNTKIEYLLQSITEQAPKIVSAEYACLKLKMEGGFEEVQWMVGATVTPDNVLIIKSLDKKANPFSKIELGDLSVRLRDIQEDLYLSGLQEGFSIRNFLSVPIRFHGRSMGHLCLGNRIGAEEFSLHDQKAIELLAEHAAIAIDHAQLHQNLSSEIDERKSAESMARRNEAFMNKIIETIPIGIWFIDGSGRIVMANEEARKIWGGAKYLNSNQFGEYKGWWADSGKEIQTQDWAAYRAITQGESSINEVVKILCFDGQIKYILNSAVPVLLDDQQKIIGAIIVNEDITSRREVQQKLKQSEERLRKLTEASDAVVFSLGFQPDFHVEYMSESSSQLLGFPVEEFYKNTKLLLEQIYPQDRNKFEQLIKSPQREIGSLVLRWIRPDSGIVWLETRVVPTQLDQGAVVKVDGKFRDITTRILEEEERTDLLYQIKVEKSWLNAVVESAPAGIHLLRGEKGDKIQSNQKAKDIFGNVVDWSQGIRSIIGRLCDKNGQPLLFEQLPASRALRGEILSFEEYRVRLQDRREISVAINAAPIHDFRGKIIGAVVIFQDITPIKELERLREEWASVIAHDLRQPITSIQLQAEVLHKLPGAPPQVNRLAEHIETGAKRLSRMTHDLLDVSQLEAHQLRLDLQMIDVKRLVNDVVERLKNQLQGTLVKVDVKNDIPALFLDPGRFEQILGNLISNAKKYGFSDTEILISLEQKNEVVQIGVTNQGKGIEREDLESLFQRFQRTSWVKQKKIKGIGLGLYITKGLVEAQGGRIQAESEPGKSTTFRITFPIQRAKAA